MKLFNNNNMSCNKLFFFVRPYNKLTMATVRDFFLIILINLLNCSLLTAKQTPDPIRIFVSISGNDSNKGTLEQPLASLKAARMAVRNLKENGGIVSSPVEIIIRGGIYYLEETLELEPEDSGTKDAPVTWRAAENEKVVLSGGKALKGKWEKDTDGLWSVDVPQTKGWIRNVNKSEAYQKKPDGPWHFRQLFVDDKRAIRARFPNVDAQNPFLYAVDGTTDYVQLPAGQVKMSWGEEPDAQINIVPKWRFYNQWNDVARVDVNKSTIYIGSREKFEQPMDKGSWFWIEGVKSELDAPNEWYLDAEKGRLYFLPEKGQNPNKLDFVAPWLNRILYLKGDVEKGTHVQYVNFRGLEFRHTSFTLGQIEARVHTDGAAMFENASDCSIEDCHFENIGGYALWLHLDSKNNKFRMNTVANSGGGGVLLTGARLSYMDDSKIYTPGEMAMQVAPVMNEISHNTVMHCGKIRYYGGGVHVDSRPASMAHMTGNSITHNHFYDLSRNGIFMFRNQGGTIIAFNEINNCMQTTIDGACIHLASMNRFNAPNFILNNYLHDAMGFEQHPDGIPTRTLANGIFLDWATSNTTVKHNYVYNTGGETIKNIMGNWNLDIEDNYVSDTRMEPPFLGEIGPRGKVEPFINPNQLVLNGRVITCYDEVLVTYSGKWEQTTVSGMRNLFQYNHQIAPSDSPSACTYNLPIKESGKYKICLSYFSNKRYASNAKIKVRSADGEKLIIWDFRKGDMLGFAVRLGDFNFAKDQPASVTISNEQADGYIVADGVGFIEVD